MRSPMLFLFETTFCGAVQQKIKSNFGLLRPCCRHLRNPTANFNLAVVQRASQSVACLIQNIIDRKYLQHQSVRPSSRVRALVAFTDNGQCPHAVPTECKQETVRPSTIPERDSRRCTWCQGSSDYRACSGECSNRRGAFPSGDRSADPETIPMSAIKHPRCRTDIHDSKVRPSHLPASDPEA